ncbi:Ammonium transporter Rh type C [Thelohanellus kitauei]|uniref:Ammonium transporter Rh type C n=1 Tax=Thelohanellus kitauei TaxID=669202 RepID=A0A0C2NBM9_THEKT|nr:Ammonium transporter Rh type C [Thelohanellus kitauei]
MGRKYEYCARGISFGLLVIILEITFFVLYCVLVNYGNSGPSPFLFPYFNTTNFTNNSCCTSLCNIKDSSTLVLLGLGMFFSMIRCTSLSGMGYILFLLAVSLQWGGLVLPWMFQAALDFFQPQYIYMTSSILCDVMYAAFALSISYGALVGIVSRVQALIMIIFGVPLFSVNRLVVVHYLWVSDVGGSVTVFMFGGLFGLSILFALLCRDKNWCCIYKRERDGDTSQIITAFVGTATLVVTMPAILTAPFPANSELFERAWVNYFFSITSAIMMAYATSSFVTKCCKLTAIHVMCGTIAGSVIIAAVAPLIIQVWGAILLGVFAGFTVVLFVRYTRLIKYIRSDIFGIFWTFVFSGFVGGVASAIMAAIVYDTSDEILTLSEFILIYPAIVFGNLGAGSPRSASEQGGYQMLGVVVSLGISICGGILVGLLMRWVGPLEDDEYFNDSTMWKVCCCGEECCRCEKAVTPCERVALPPI